jgi:DNA-binding beta-propeller fold protein YncE
VRRATLCAAAGLAGVSLLVACRATDPSAGATQASCGERERVPERLPPFPEPARSPALAERPAGRVIRLPGRPEGLAYDASTGRLAVGINDPRGLVLFVDGRTGETLRRVPLPAGPRHLRFARPGGPVLVPAETANALLQVPQERGASIRTAVGRQPHDATAAARGRIFVVNEHDSSMSVVAGDRVICTLPTPANPGGVVADQAGSRVGAVGVRANTLRLYDARMLRGLGEVGAGIGPTHVVSNGKRTLHVADTRGDAVISIRTRPRLELYSRQALPDSAPYGLAYDLRRRELWVTSTARNRVVLFRNLERIRSFPTVRQPNAVAVDERSGRVFVAGRYEELQLIDPPQD